MDLSDKDVVAMIHGDIIDKTWISIMEYESLHFGCV